MGENEEAAEVLELELRFLQRTSRDGRQWLFEPIAPEQ